MDNSCSTVSINSKWEKGNYISHQGLERVKCYSSIVTGHS